MSLTTREWYLVLTRTKDLIFVDSWVLYQKSEEVIELIREDGEMATARVEEDGVGRIRGSPKILPLPPEVTNQVKQLLGISNKEQGHV